MYLEYCRTFVINSANLSFEAAFVKSSVGALNFTLGPVSFRAPNPFST